MEKLEPSPAAPAVGSFTAQVLGCQHAIQTTRRGQGRKHLRRLKAAAVVRALRKTI